MSRFYSRWLLVFAMAHLLTATGTKAREPIEWDPISLSASFGSWNVSAVYQGYQCPVVPTPNLGESTYAYKARLKKWRLDCPSAKDPDPQEPCDQCITVSQERIDIPQRAKNPNAFELEFGNSDVDLTTSQGAQDDLFYIAAGYRRFLAEFFKNDRIRIFAGAGLGVYFVEPDEKLGFNLKLGGELAPIRRNSKRPFVPIEIAVTYHQLDSGFDFTDVTIGIRVHTPRR